MSGRLSVRVPDELAERVDARARRLGTSRSEVVRAALRTGVPPPPLSPAAFAELMRRAATLRARQTRRRDVAALIREVRGGDRLRLPLMRLTVPFGWTDPA